MAGAAAADAAWDAYEHISYSYQAALSAAMAILMDSSYDLNDMNKQLAQSDIYSGIADRTFTLTEIYDPARAAVDAIQFKIDYPAPNKPISAFAADAADAADAYSDAADACHEVADKFTAISNTFAADAKRAESTRTALNTAADAYSDAADAWDAAADAWDAAADAYSDAADAYSDAADAWITPSFTGP